MRYVTVDSSNRHEFVVYALAHGPEHDDSFANPEDIKSFDPATERAVLAMDEHDRVVGAASLMVRGYAAEGMARFRVLHARREEAYGPLVAEALVGLDPAVHLVFHFLPEPCPAEHALAAQGFREIRRATILRRDSAAVPAPVAAPPPGVTLRVADPERDAAAWAEIANLAFGGDPGRFDMTAEAARTWLQDPRVIGDGPLAAERAGRMVGIAMVMDEAAPDGGEPAHGAEIGRVGSLENLAVAPEEQGRGVGRSLLRAAIAAATEAGFPVVELSTGALNRRALDLYLSEGFESVDTRVCWGRSPRP